MKFLIAIGIIIGSQVFPVLIVAWLVMRIMCGKRG